MAKFWLHCPGTARPTWMKCLINHDLHDFDLCLGCWCDFLYNLKGVRGANLAIHVHENWLSNTCFQFILIFWSIILQNEVLLKFKLITKTYNLKLSFIGVERNFLTKAMVF